MHARSETPHEGLRLKRRNASQQIMGTRRLAVSDVLPLLKAGGGAPFALKLARHHG